MKTKREQGGRFSFYGMILVPRPLVFLFVLVNLLTRYSDFDAILLLHLYMLCVQHFYAAFVLLSGLLLLKREGAQSC